MQYSIVKSRRRTISLEVRNGSIIVRAPLLASKFIINKFVEEKSWWIKKHLVNSEKTRPLDKDRIMLSGKIIKLIFDPATTSSRFENETLKIGAVSNSTKHKELKLKQFLLHVTKKKIEKYLLKYSGQFGFGFKCKIKAYKSKWGSCSLKNDLTFNLKLAMAPDEIIEYVVVHELCHTKVKNHSNNFWKLVCEFIPDYKIRRKWLRENHHLFEYENR